jgi:hypothetical protein
MFAYILNNVFQYFIPQGVAFKLNGKFYASDWLNLSTPAEKAALGIVDVVYAQRPDDKYYWVTELPPTYNAETKQVDVAYTSIAKDLAGCIKQAVSDLQQQVYSLLQPTDYIDLRNLRDPEYKLDWMAWRDEIRVQYNAQDALITACTDVAELAALPSVEWAHDPNWVEPAVGPALESAAPNPPQES